MLEVVFSSERFPGSSARIRPATAAQDWTIQYGVVLLRFEDVQLVFAQLCTDWTNAPYFAKHKGVCEKFDRAMIQQLDPEFVLEVCRHAREMAQLTEDELKNSLSPPT